jgi:hypothetical protein
MCHTLPHPIDAAPIRPLAPGRGRSLATALITVEGCTVGYMHREQPDDDGDSGWRFLAGTETDEDMDDAGNHGIYGREHQCGLAHKRNGYLSMEPSHCRSVRRPRYQ